MKLIDLLKSPYWARIHEEIWTELKQRGVLKIEDAADYTQAKEVYDNLVKTGTHISKTSFVEILGIAPTTAHNFGFFKK